jgi:hypothetical protein
MGGNPLFKIDFGELSKPATVLIEKVANALEGLARPSQIVRVAKAEAEAERIHAESQVKIGDIERRAFHRWLKEEVKKQGNIEEITRKAISLLGKDSRPQDVDDDWIAHFFDRGRLTSDEAMQRLWSSVLAGEANEPGSFSRRTVNLLADLNRADAELFTRVCDFGWLIEGHELGQLRGCNQTALQTVPVIFSVGEKIYRDNGLSYAKMCHLDSLGLVRYNDFSVWWHGIPQVTQMFYFEKRYPVAFREPNFDKSEYGVPIGNILFTRAGYELARICPSKPIEGFFEYTVAKWEKCGATRDQGFDGRAPTHTR